MNNDQRIDALTQSVELLSHMHQDNEKRYAAQFEVMGAALIELKGMTGRIVGICETLGKIVTDHDARLKDLEDR